MSKRKKRKRQKSTQELSSPPSDATEPLRSGTGFMKPRIYLYLILCVGASLRIWGISDRHFTETDTSNKWNFASMYEATWQWVQTGACRQMSFPDYCEAEFGVNCMTEEGGKALERILRGIVILVTGDRSLILYSLLDIAFAIAAMAMMLFTCREMFGARIAILSGFLWLLGGSQFIATGRGYEYSALTFFATMAWTLFMRRKRGGRSGFLHS